MWHSKKSRNCNKDGLVVFKKVAKKLSKVNYSINFAAKIIMLSSLLLSIATIVYAQAVPGTEKIVTTIAQDTYLSISLVIAVFGLVVAVVVQLTESRGHRSNNDIHHTTGELYSNFVSNHQCSKMNTVLERRLDDLQGNMNCMREDMIKIKTKLGVD